MEIYNGKRKTIHSSEGEKEKERIREKIKKLKTEKKIWVTYSNLFTIFFIKERFIPIFFSMSNNISKSSLSKLLVIRRDKPYKIRKIINKIGNNQKVTMRKFLAIK